jgi:DNA-binding HxlR family transcriptional regulator
MTETEEGKKLEALILKAIDDLELDDNEYEEIMAQANADGQIDPHEKQLLDKLQKLIEDGVVQRVAAE